MKHDEYTLFKKKVGNNIIRMMFFPLMPDIYKNIQGSKKFLVTKYAETNDKQVPKKGKGDRNKFIQGLSEKWWFSDGKKAANKFNKL